MRPEIMPLKSRHSFSAFSTSSGLSVHSPGDFRHGTEGSTIAAWQELSIVARMRVSQSLHLGV
jgi:hypothetical protein